MSSTEKIERQLQVLTLSSRASRLTVRHLGQEFERELDGIEGTMITVCQRGRASILTLTEDGAILDVRCNDKCAGVCFPVLDIDLAIRLRECRIKEEYEWKMKVAPGSITEVHGKTSEILEKVKECRLNDELRIPTAV